MSTLLLRLAGPLQSWGDSSRFVRRETRPEPTKSGVLGLIAAAQGRRRTDTIEDLVRLRFGVRVDQPGQLVRDFQTAQTRDGKSMPLSNRYYLADAVFVVGVEGPAEVVTGIRDALMAPTFPLYLGRRSCPPAGRLVLGVNEADLVESLREEPWQAARWYRRQQSDAGVDLPIIRDGQIGEAGETVRDEPISFSPIRREYGWRTVVYESTPHRVENPEGRRAFHDPFSLLGGS